MQLARTEQETRALLNLLTETIENDRYPFSPRSRTLRGHPREDGTPTAACQAAKTRGARPELAVTSAATAALATSRGACGSEHFRPNLHRIGAARSGGTSRQVTAAEDGDRRCHITQRVTGVP